MVGFIFVLFVEDSSNKEVKQCIFGLRVKNGKIVRIAIFGIAV
jgi:hypothetical protein